MTNEKTKEMGVGWLISVWGSAFTILAGGFVGLVAFFNLKVVSTDSVVSVNELNANYLHRSKVEASYVEKERVYQQYVPKEEVETILEGYISAETVREDYVPRQQYVMLTRENASLKDELYGIPSPLEPIRRELSPSGKWHDERLGVFVEMKESFGVEGHMSVRFALQLPDSPLHDEYVSEDKDSVRQWRFHEDGREFELVMERVYPPVFVVREI